MANNSMTVRELIKKLKTAPQDWPVYLSIDPEGNAYGSLRADYLFGGSNEDKVLTLMPIDTGFVDEDLMPLQHEIIMKELKEEGLV